MIPRSAATARQFGQRMWTGLVDILFPPRCGGCQAEGSLWCQTCAASLVFVQPPTCDKCGEPNTVGLCSKCQAQPLQIEAIYSAVVFDGQIRHAVHGFKYERQSSLAEPFGRLLAAYWQSRALHADWLIPVPLHAARQRERGYNQSELLARQLSRQVGVPTLPNGLRRTRATKVQMQLNAAERKINVAGAFQADDVRLRGRRAVVIDDVCTTGATLDACAIALLQAGAASVIGLTLARTP